MTKVNEVKLVGRLSKDLELREFGEGKKVVTLTIATNPFNKKTNFIEVSAWDGLAEEIATKYSKGSKIEVVARLKQKISEQKGLKDYNYQLELVSYNNTEKSDENRVDLIGRLTKDPEVKVTPSGKFVANITVAINEGNRKAQFINLTVWDEKATEYGNILKKTDLVNVKARIKNSIKEREDVKFYGYDFDINSIVKVEKENEQQNTEEGLPWEGEIIA